MEQKTHWKKAFKSDYLSASDIDEKDLILTIKNVIYKECTTQSGKKYCNVAIFTDTKLDNKLNWVGGTKPMILNVTNSKIVKKFSGNKTHLEDWNNIRVQIYVDSNVRFGTDTVEGLRIRPNQPKIQKELPSIKESDISNVLEYLRGGKTIEDLRKIRSFDKAMENKLKNALNES